MNEITSEVDYIPDSQKEKEPQRSCKNCFHSNVCYWFTQLHVLNESMKMGQTTKLPFAPSILASECNAFVLKHESQKS